MAQLKRSVVERIYKELNNRLFSVDDFDISFPTKNGHYLEVHFRHDSSYVFQVIDDSIGSLLKPLEQKWTPATVESPGDFKAKEVKHFDSYENCIARIEPWCRNIKSDLRANIPVMEELDELKRNIEEHIEESLENPEERFTEEEINSLRERFDALYEQFRELSERHEITEEQLKRVQDELDIIKQSAAEYPKGLWANLTKNRLISVVRKIGLSREGRQIMYEGAKKLIGL